MVTEAKAVLRRRLRSARGRLHPEHRDAETERTVAALRRWLERLGWPPVASYAATGSELDLADLHRRIWRRNGTLLLPRVSGERRLTWHRIDAETQLEPGFHGILEPDPGLAPTVDLHDAVVLLVPGVGFTVDGHRLGQGGGFYDQLIAHSPHAVTVGVGFACQRVESVPCEDHDAVLERVLLGGRWVR